MTKYSVFLVVAATWFYGTVTFADPKPGQQASPSELYACMDKIYQRWQTIELNLESDSSHQYNRANAKAAAEPTSNATSYPFYDATPGQPGLYVVTPTAVHYYSPTVLQEKCQVSPVNIANANLAYDSKIRFSIQDRGGKIKAQVAAPGPATEKSKPSCTLERNEVDAPKLDHAVNRFVNDRVSEMMILWNGTFHDKEGEEINPQARPERAKTNTIKEIRDVYAHCGPFNRELKTRLETFAQELSLKLNPNEKERIHHNLGNGSAI